MLVHVIIQTFQLLGYLYVIEDGGGCQEKEEEGEHYFQNSDLPMVDIGVDGRQDLINKKRVF